ncbi:MAG: prolyl oligopeptidase family serine peptidase [Candidatus Aminicenantales bacterium]
MPLTRKLFLGLTLFVILGLFPLLAEQKLNSAWKIDDVIRLESASDFDISPDGNWVVWVKNTPDKEKNGRSRHLYLSPLGSAEEAIELTRGSASEFNPRWSPAGKWIAFLSTRPEKEETKEESQAAQLWLLDRRGGEPWKATDLTYGVLAFDWVDDNEILFLAREEATWRERQAKEKKDTALVAEDQDHMPPQRLFSYRIQDKKTTRLTLNTDQITTFALSPQKRWVITRNNQSVRYEVDKKIKPRFFLWDRQHNISTEIFTDPSFKPARFYWAADEKGFYFTVTRTSDPVHEGPGADFLYYFDLETKAHQEIPLNWEWGVFDLGFQVRDDGFIACLANGARPKWRRYTRKGNSYSHQDLEGEHLPNVYGLYLQKKGNRAVYAYSRASVPTQWYTAQLSANVLSPVRKITNLNAHLEQKIMARTEVVRWRGALNEEIEGILYYPHDYTAGRRYPLVVMIHGGPTGVDMDVFDESYAYYPNLMAQRGAFVLMPNYHGSGGYGQQFAESIRGRYYELEIPDILNGIDWLIEKGLVDPEALATMGWSNGGILSMGLTTWTNRFKVAGVGAADVNWISDYGNCAFGVSFDNYYFKGAPWDELEHYIQKSPLFHLKTMKVPTIIFHGTEDTNVPYGQGWEYYRALQQIGQAPVRFIIFPNEPHGLRKLTHQQRKMEEELAWFDRYFFKSEKPAREALKKDSPLDIALRMKEVARVDRFFGLSLNDHLIPETVEVEGLRVGRFEVTRAQWAAYDRSYSYEPGTENFPATGMTFEKAQAYIRWLSQETGLSFRLPRTKEAEKLAEMAGKNENTLDFWAGYSPTPDETKLLVEAIEELLKPASLLVPVDRSLSSSEPLIFGLGGNAAEWAEGEKGEGKVVGLSAVRPNDPRAMASPPPLEYTGLRVVLDEKKRADVIK